jgi:hypothetical protein
MKLTKFYDTWKTMRVLALSAAALIAAIGCIKGYSFNLEMEYAGPGSETERLNDACRDRDNREAAERCGRGEGNECDREKASEYEADHGA